MQFDAELTKLVGGLARQPLAENGQRRVAAIEEQDPGIVRIDLPEFGRRVLVASSRIWPASSTPVGPAPTRAKVSKWLRSAGSVAVSAISNAPNTRRLIVSASEIVFMPGAS